MLKGTTKGHQKNTEGTEENEEDRKSLLSPERFEVSARPFVVRRISASSLQLWLESCTVAEANVRERLLANGQLVAIR